MCRLATGVIFLDSEKYQELAYVLLQGYDANFDFSFIFLLHFRRDEYPFFLKWIYRKDRHQYLKQK